MKDKKSFATFGLAKVSKPWEVKECFASYGCPNNVLPSSHLKKAIEKLLTEEKLADFIEERIKSPLKHHQQFKVTIAGCPNGCSQPHIKDIGIIAQVEPELVGECKLCGACEEACKEEALTLGERFPIIDPDKCLRCGDCIKACSKGALGVGHSGYKILVGGKLGRHPQLARELVSLVSEEEVLKILKRIIEFYKEKSQGIERLGNIIKREGWKNFKNFVLGK